MGGASDDTAVFMESSGQSQRLHNILIIELDSDIEERILKKGTAQCCKTIVMSAHCLR